MAWYNSGNWDGIDAAELPNVLVSLCNAVNQRYDAQGRPRTSWIVNSGTKPDDLAFDDFVGLDIHRTNYYSQIRLAISSLVQGNVSGAFACSTGFARTTTGSGLAADGALWTIAGLLGDIGTSELPTPSNIFDLNYAYFLRDMLDRLIYPVVYPLDAGGVNTRPRVELDIFGPDAHPHVEGTDNAGDVWRDMISVADAVAANSLTARVSFNSADLWFAHRDEEATVSIDCLQTQNNNGFKGTIAKQIVSLGVVASYLNSATIGFHGATQAVSGTVGEFYESTDCDPLDVDGATTVTMTFDSIDETNSPFTGYLEEDGNTYEDFGSFQAFIATGAPSYTRMILDASSVLDDQT